MKSTLARALLAASAFVAGANLTPADASTVMYTGSLNINTGTDCGGANGPCNLAASVSFNNDTAGQLVVTLTNTSTDDVYFPIELLSGVFWSGTSGLSSLTGSAVLGAGSSILQSNGTPPVTTVVGGEFGYAAGINGPGDSTVGLSSTGLGLFGDATFPGGNLDDPLALDGPNYGILSAGDNAATGNPAILGKTHPDITPGYPLIKNSVVFTLIGTVNQIVSLALLDNVWFQYGTDLSEPSYQGTCTSGCSGGSVPEVPLPAALPLLLGGLGGMAWLSRRQKRKNLTAV